ncbi:cytochrome c-type biogenesis protein CcdA [Thermosipho africanus TCF52B]|uniref:Cytochrome c-type biogenesis protein CcdA n=1 Tax=Thermosipho africanus (strain TCF52B) TaxID=484019 RepID=B7ICV0_THEAB|nr:cytochrome c biogenesis CcdA family protein [Thermosipho africanus]ACJ75827.1 cytochrome c-type biogenesis protein CcdA [Thermosipho africanus TCF52B]
MFYKDVSIWIAFLHGILSFFSPCVLPLIPAFLGVLFTAKNKFLKLFGFFIGFSVFFSIIGIFSSVFGIFFSKYGTVINYILGTIIIVMGILYMSNKEIVKPKKINVWNFKGGSLLTGILMGAAVGLIWIPCSSPILGSILTIATTVNPYKGGLLLFIYSLGISLPFLTIGAPISKLLTGGFGTPKWEKILKIFGGVFLIILGILIISGKMVV